MNSVAELKETQLQLKATQEQLKRVETTLKLIAKAQVEFGAKINVLAKETTGMVFKLKECVSPGKTSWAPVKTEVPIVIISDDT